MLVQVLRKAELSGEFFGLVALLSGYGSKLPSAKDLVRLAKSWITGRHQGGACQNHVPVVCNGEDEDGRAKMTSAGERERLL